MARSVLDQDPGGADLLGYGAARKPQSRETLSRLLVPLVWEFMVGDLGAPVGIDTARVRELRTRLKELNQQEELLHRMHARVEQETRDARAEAQRRHGTRRPRQFGHLSKSDLWIHMQEAQGLLMARFDEIDATAARQRSDIDRQIRAVGRLRRQTEKDLTEAETTEVPLPDLEREMGWMPGTHGVSNGPNGAEDEEPDGSDEVGDGYLEPVRSLLWPAEVGELLGKSQAQITRWLDAEYLEKARRTHGVPWSAEDIREGRLLVVESARRRLVRAHAIHRDALSVEQQKRLALMLAHPLPARKR